jgi:hypothetical protein
MRIRRSAGFILHQTTKMIAKKTTQLTLGAVVILVGVTVGQNLLSPPTSYAAVAPDSCFDFTAGTIAWYYRHEGNDDANPACPTVLDIPQTIGGVPVTALGASAFYDNKLSSVTIPEGVTSIGDGAFYKSQLASVVIPASVTSIGPWAFYGNKLSSVTLLGTPSSIGDSAVGNNPIAAITYGDITHLASHQVLPIPSQCFDHDEGTLTSYRFADLALIVTSGTACLATDVHIPGSLDGVTITGIGDSAFSRKQLTAVTIPASVTSIGYGAFSVNSISQLTIPDSVTTIGGYAFSTNQLTSLSLGCGSSSLPDQVFSVNKLTAVTIPDCINAIDPTAFFGQNPWGGLIDSETDAAYDWYSKDPDILQRIYDNLWYVQLRTETPSNPNHLSDGIVTEAWYTGDLNGDGDENDSLGGHLVNPAALSVGYVDESNQSLAPAYQSTGQLTDGTNLTDYLVKHVATPAIEDSFEPTAEEQTALEVSLSQFHRLGQTISLSAPIISGYALLHPSSPHMLQLTDTLTALNFTYGHTATLSPSVPQPPQPATGADAANGQATARSHDNKVAAPSAYTSADLDTTTTDIPKTTTVDFGARSAAATNLTPVSVLTSLAPIMASSSFGVDATKPCSQIESAQLLPHAAFTSPVSGEATLGGLSFMLSCSAAGGDATVSLTLGDTLSDLSTVKVYKQDSHGISSDITNQVTLTNRTANGRTAISYHLRDGQALDDDETADGSISDPIYLTVAGSQPQEEASTIATTSNKQKAIPVLSLTLAALSLVAVTAITTLIIRSKRRR